MIPVPITDGALNTLAPEVLDATKHIKHYVAENARTTRRMLKLLHPDLVIETLKISEIDKHQGPDTATINAWLKAGHDVGMMSEAGCPGIADPGAAIAALAHKAGVDVVPLTGPSSILLALMASGLNGQCFAFNGYLPVKEPMRGKRIKELEALSAKEKQTQIFIETPYRNTQLMNELLKQCKPDTMLCIAQNISAPNAFIKTRTLGAWTRDPAVLEKAPAVFLLLA